MKYDIKRALEGLKNDDMPTLERLAKSDFKKSGAVWRTRTISDRLYASERLSQDEYNSCCRWRETYILTYDGVAATQDHASTSEIKHDEISWRLHMANEALCIPEIRSFIGRANHNILILSLYHGFSASEISRLLTKRSDKTALIDRVCLGAYKKLNNFYMLHKKSLAGMKVLS